MELHEAFINFFEENLMGLLTEDWISGVQIALNTSLADNSAAKGTDQNAFNILCQKADKLSKDLSDIHGGVLKFGQTGLFSIVPLRGSFGYLQNRMTHQPFFCVRLFPHHR